MNDLSNYLRQYEGLVQVLKNLENKYGGTYKPGAKDRQVTILHLIRALRQFAEGQFQFFYQGFGGQPRTASYPNLNPSPEYPNEHVLALTLAQIAEDVALIERIAAQRLGVVPTVPEDTESTGDGTKTVNKVKTELGGNQTNILGEMTIPEFLWKMDELAMTALWPDGIPAESGTGEIHGNQSFDYDFEVKLVLTYFHKEVDVRVLPYAKVALIGIPYACLDDVRVLMAIPHEVGHFRFWYSFRQEADTLIPELVGANANLRELFYPFYRPAGDWRWSEEIFADVYGVLIGGPVSALTAQEMALNSSTFGFANFDSDNEHPVPLLRPLVQIKAIKAFSDKLSSVPQSERDVVASQLWELWVARLKTRGILDAEGKFKSAELERQVANQTAWKTELEPNVGKDFTVYPIDALIQRAIEALEYAFEHRSGSKIPALDWGWSRSNAKFSYNLYDTKVGADVSIEKLDLNKDVLLTEYVQHPVVVDAVNGTHVFDAGLIEQHQEPLIRLEPWDKDRFSIPELWFEWAATRPDQPEIVSGVPPLPTQPSGSTRGAKRLVQHEKLRSDQALGPIPTLESGTYEKDMDPKGKPYPVDRWIRVFGAGGWTTEGPCVMPPG